MYMKQFFDLIYRSKIHLLYNFLKYKYKHIQKLIKKLYINLKKILLLKNVH